MNTSPFDRANKLFRCIILTIVVANLVAMDESFADQEPTRATPPHSSERTAGVIVAADQVTAANLEHWKQKAYCVALMLTSTKNAAAESKAAHAIKSAGLQLEYFIEIGRCPELASQHPEWQASLQGHSEWRKRFPDVGEPTRQQVVKNEPWVPILYRESFDAHIERVKHLLLEKPTAVRIWFNDLQGAPSACGCGHPLCRWTADYGPIKTATPLGQNAAAKFVAAIKTIATKSSVIPIFVGECEADDKDTVCCGVNCFTGKCWVEFTQQLDALAQEADQIGVACFYRAFDRDLPRYGKHAGWVSYSLKSFGEMPPQRNGTGVAPERLIAILQGWDVSEGQVAAQIEQAKSVNSSGYMIAITPIEQSWQPMLFDLPGK